MATRQVHALHVEEITTDGYIPIDGRNLETDTFAKAAHRWTAAATARHLRIKLHDAPGAGKSRTVRLLVDAVAVLSVTLSDSQTDATVVGSGAIALNAKACIHHDSIGTPTDTRMRVTFTCDYDDDGVVCYGGGGGFSGAGGANTGPFSSSGSWDNVGAVFNRNVAPAPGTIDRLAIDMTGAVPAGQTMQVVFSIDGASVGSVHTLTEGETTLAAVISIAFVAGDRVLVHATPSWDASSIVMLFGIRVTGTDGESFMCSRGITQLPGANATRYLSPMQGKGSLSTSESLVAVQGGVSVFVLRHLYVFAEAASLSVSPITFTVRRDGLGTALALTTPFLTVGADATTTNLTDEIRVDPEDTLSVQFVTGSNWFQGRLSWGMVQEAFADDSLEVDDEVGVIGPLLWAEFLRRVVQDGSPGASPQAEGVTQLEVYSDFDMYCPEGYYGGFKEGRILAAGDAERALSDWFTGDWTGSTYRLTLADHDSKFRRQLASYSDRYWTEPIAVRMTTRENRAVLGNPYTIFVGPIIEAQPASPLALQLTLGDSVSHGMLSDRLQIPWRLIRDGFLDQLDAISERLDQEQPEPIIYGIHNREAGVDESPTSPHGFRITPIYLGLETVNSVQYHVWMVAGHACKGINIYVDGELQDESDDWLIPGQAGFTAEFGDVFVDKASSAYPGVTRRYTLIYGLVGSGSPWYRFLQSNADECAVGEKVLTCDVEGIEDTGDGTGSTLLDIFEQYQHFLINFVARSGPDSYQSGDWLTNPVWSVLNRDVQIVEESSFSVASATAQARFSGNDIYGGYVGAAAIGIRAGDRASARHWISVWNRSSGARFGITAWGEMRVVLPHPTEAERAGAMLITDAYEVIQGTFGTVLGWADRVTSVPFRGDNDPVSQQWKTSGTATNDDAIDRYGADKVGDIREYPFSPGLAQTEHLATLELAARVEPLRVIRYEVPIGSPTVSAAYLDLGDYFRYIHYDAVSEERTERLAMVTRHQVRGSARAVLIEGIDVEELIGFAEGSS